MISEAFFSRAVAPCGFASGESLADNQKAGQSESKLKAKCKLKAPSDWRAQYTIKRKRLK